MWLFVGVAPSPALAWGSIGHRVVGQVADKHLTPKAVARVSKIMGSSSLGDVANWMDQVRGTPEGAAMQTWHYESIQACEPRKSTCSDKQCAGAQIGLVIEALKSGQGDQLKALRVLVHLVGDIHQPLHAAENADHGANSVKVTNRLCPKPDGTYEQCKLHSYWDNILVKKAMAGRTERAFVSELSQISVSTNGDAQSWLKESNDIAISTAHHYEGFACGIGKNKIALTKAYDKTAVVRVTEQLAKAGQRLAAILNGIYE
jgi:hypothetical protein